VPAENPAVFIDNIAAFKGFSYAAPDKSRIIPVRNKTDILTVRLVRV
jgi:hypothetical protein